MKKKQVTKMLALALAAMMGLTACGQSGEQAAADPAPEADTAQADAAQTEAAEDTVSEAAQEAPAQEASGEAITITMMQELYNETPDSESDFFTYMEEKLNVNLEVNFVPTSGYIDKVNTQLASGDLPMVLTANNSLKNSAGITNAIDNDGFWALDDYIQDYPNLYDFIGETTFNNSRIHGKIYGIPRLRILPRNGGFYRADWAEALNIEAPQTLDELYDMLYAFTYDDPDGNGKDDTWGFEMGYTVADWQSWNGIQTICVALGGPNGWSMVDGKMQPDFMSAEYKESLDFFKKLYDNGCMNKDFAVLTGNQRVDVFNEGNSGMLFHVVDDVQNIEDTLKKVVPDASLTLLPALKAEDGNTYINSTAGYNGLIMFNKYGDNAIQSEEDLRKVLSFYDSLCTEEWQDFLSYGIEGIHYEIGENGEKEFILTDDGTAVLGKDSGDFSQLCPVPAYTEKESDTDLIKDMHAQVKERENYLVSNPVVNLPSDTYTEYGSELDTIIMDANIKYIMGEIDEAGYQAEVDKWMSRGGEKVIEEYTEAYNMYN